MLNSTAKCLKPHSLQRFNHEADYFVLVTSLLASFCNVLIIWCAWRILRRNRVFTHVFVMWMSFADLILTGYSYPLFALNQIVPSLQSVFFCASIQFSTWLGLAMSGFFLIAISIDRLIFFGWPMKYIILTKQYAIGVCALVVSSSLGSVTALRVSKAAFVMDKCTTAFSHGGIYPYIAFIITTCILPIVSSAALSAYLYVMTSRRRRILPASVPKRASKQKINTLLFLFTTTIWTTLSLLPSRTVLTWLFLASPPCPSDFVFWLGSVATLATRLYPMINPAITGLVCAPYRREILVIFNEIKTCVLKK